MMTQDATDSRRTLRRIGWPASVLLIAASFAALSPAVAQADQSITSTGPLTNITIGSDLSCAVNHVGDTHGEFYGDNACGTFLAIAGGEGTTVYGPSVPFGPSVAGYSPVDQTPVTGTGSSADPFTVTTRVDAGTDLHLTQKDTYVVGDEFYTTDVSVSNSGSTGATVTLYRAGDCYLQDSDSGTGAYDPGSGAIACVAGSGGGGGATETRVEEWVPRSPGSHYREGLFSTVWNEVAAGTGFTDQCDCATPQDNGAGLSWTFTLLPGGETTRSNETRFSSGTAAGEQGVTKTIPPSGGTISNDTGPPGPDPNDPTVLQMKFGSGPGGEASLSEEPCPPDQSPCIGDVGNFQPPAGYTKLTATFLELASLVPPGTTRRDIHIYRQKDPDPAYTLLRNCGERKIPPCVLAIKQLRNGNWRFNILINSDPRLLPR
jgi:hypothetical protein